MKFSRILGYGLLLAILLSVIKIIGQQLNLESLSIRLGLFFVEAIVSATVIRRVGTMSYLEAPLIATFWLIFLQITDLLVTGLLTGYALFGTGTYWISYIVVWLSIFLFHSKRHVEIRRKLRKN